MQGREFDLGELVKEANRQFAGAGLAVPDERVSAELDARTVRYYQTEGLISAPAGYEGRRARYTYRHLLQLVAIKALQAQGLSLAQARGWLPDKPVEALQAALAGSLAAGDGNPLSGLPAPDASQVPHEAPMGQRGAPAGLSAYRLAPGVNLLIDPDLVPDPARLAKALMTRLDGEG